MSILLDIDHVSKHVRSGFWGTKTPILHDVTIQAHAGETFGLLGPNGAGKTTTLKIATGLIRPSRGSVSIWGRDPRLASIRARIGFLPESGYLYAHLTAAEFLRYCGSLHGMPELLTRARSGPLLERVGLFGVGTKLIRNYSKGMLQRLGFAQALINEPEFLFLDEPMSGLDPLGRHEIKQLILELKAEGRTVFFNSHILADVEAVCDRVAILVDGKVASQGRITDLLAYHAGSYTLAVKGLDRMGMANLTRIALNASQDDDGMCYAKFIEWDQAVKGAAVARQSGAEIVGIDRQKQSLESYFVKTVATAKAATAPKARG
ncbi:MAG: ABC transporter ATP-binding protein [Candidatus Sericytochromatia bacterium]|nr:ABC transporter ATP-binding protein [Candidatus Sericytochromatia bacterium]